MSLYSFGVFVHVVAAIALVGSSLFAPVLGSAVRRAASVESLREWAGYLQRTGKLLGAAAPVVLASGVYLGFAGGWWGSGWLEVSLVLFLVAGAIALGVLDRAAAQLVAHAAAAAPGPVPTDLDARRRAPLVATAESYLLGVDLTIVFLMTNKPAWSGSLAAVAVGVAFGALLATRERRHLTPRAPAAG